MFYVTDIVNFTNMSFELSAITIVEMLDGLYNLFDTIAHKHGVYKVEILLMCNIKMAL
jgi:class 3 adenylate cyclase